jgi:hypothetical protein
MSEENGLEKFAELYQICIGTQEFFWKQVIDKLDIDSMLNDKLSGDVSGNKEFLKKQLERMVEDMTESISAKTAVVLMGIILVATTKSTDSGNIQLKRFDSRFQELVEDYLVTDSLKYVLNEARREKGEI